MKYKNEQYGCGMISFIIALVAVIYYLCVIWADWVIKSIWDKDINNWLILAAFLVLGLFTPKSLRGWPMLLVAIGTVYIWVFL